MHFYADVHGGRLPPAVLYDAAGRPLHSWRVLLLPHLEEEALFKEFRLDEPWDSPHNRALLPRIPAVYAVPPGLPDEVRAKPSATFYQVFVGRGTAFEGRQGLRLPGDFPGGTAKTVLVVEAAGPVPWTRPADLAYEPGRPLPALGGMFTGEGRFSLFGPSRVKGFHVALADASVRFFRGDPDEQALRALITRDGGAAVDPSSLE